ncbi:MAG: hypothetical protein NZ523_05390 [Elioraea sp.]|nr:hypothetical protein [Elioraea sp.]
MKAGTIRSAYLAAEGYEAQLAAELARRGASVAAWHGRLALSPEPALASAWALNVWRDPRMVPIASISDAAARLRAVQRNWWPYAPVHHRRTMLIAERLPHVSARPLVFPAAPPRTPLGSFTLLAPDLMLASPDCTSPFPNGEARFVEDREGPPSRAYLKLWEALALLRSWPQAGELCLDLGASPGGWSWALAQLGARVIAVDKAPLEPRVAALPNVTVRRESAFGLDPKRWRDGEGPVDWLFSDVVAYPVRLLRLVRAWIAAGAARRILCTVKFQGRTDHAAAEAFAAIPGAWLRHLSHNRHELTFAWGFA